LTVAQTSPNGTVVGTVVASDPNSGDILTYSISAGNTNNTFAINAVTGQLTVADNTQLNFEVTPSFSLTVTVTDSGGLQTTATVTITLTNVNEAPTIPTGQTFSLPENSANGTVVGTVTAADPDAGDTRSFALSGTAFAINAAGQLTVANSSQLNFEVTPSFSLTVTVTDSGGLQATATITIQLTNVNEAPTITTGQTFSLPENSANGTIVGTVTAADPDAGDTRTFTLTGTAFAIQATTGLLTVADSSQLNFEVTPSFAPTVTVTDAGGLQTATTITINLTAVDEPPGFTSSPGNQSSTEGQAVSLQIAASDPEGAPLAFTVANIPNGLIATTSANAVTISGTLACGAALQSPYNVLVTVSEVENPTNAAALNITWQVNPFPVNTLCISSPTGTLTPEETRTLRVVFRTTKHVSAYVLSLTFDTNVLTITEIKKGIAPLDELAVNLNASTNEGLQTAKFAAYNPLFLAASGSVHLVDVTIQAVAAGDSNLALAIPEGDVIVVASDTNNDNIVDTLEQITDDDISVVNGFVTVVNP
jgi:VCBS repeat-containing protein